MDWFTGLATYILIWWVMLFTVLPLGIEKPDTPERGHDRGAPVAPHLKRKFILTTGLAFAVWVVLYAVIRIFDLSLLEMFR